MDLHFYKVIHFSPSISAVLRSSLNALGVASAASEFLISRLQGRRQGSTRTFMNRRKVPAWLLQAAGPPVVLGSWSAQKKLRRTNGRSSISYSKAYAG